MNKKFIKSVLITFILILAVIFLWYGYSWLYFYGSFSPLYAIGLSNPHVYYQKHIGALLLKYGQEYEIDDVDTSKWKNYRDEKLGFEFKYPTDLETRVPDNGPNGYYRINFINKDNFKEECILSIETSGWKFGKYGLPLDRSRTVDYIEHDNKNGLWYIQKKNGDMFRIMSTRFDGKKQKIDVDDIRFTSTTFISKTPPFQFIQVADGGNRCLEDTMKGIFATFNFIK
ncbi:MAG: hypothetical protein ACD_15C00114G0009 [uncultured bacterium]|nr:MAG: hypothetical protein ACD_15C00114G0009 [uncultured bacterium]